MMQVKFEYQTRMFQKDLVQRLTSLSTHYPVVYIIGLILITHPAASNRWWTIRVLRHFKQARRNLRSSNERATIEH